MCPVCAGGEPKTEEERKRDREEEEEQFLLVYSRAGCPGIQDTG